MNELDRIHDQMRRAYAGEAWHGPSLRPLLAEISATTAPARPIAGAHSLWEITLHLAAWTDTVRRRCQGERVIEPLEGDWPAVGNLTDAAWQAVLDSLDERHEQLLEAISRLDATRLDEPLFEGSSSFYVTLHGHIQHLVYHTGQIALLRKA